MITIQTLESKYWNQIQNLINSYKEPNPETITYEEWSSQSHCHMHIALDGDTVVGMITHMIEINPRGGKICHISDLFVAKDYRKKGVAKKLQDAGTDLAYKYKCYKKHATCTEAVAKISKSWGLSPVGVNVVMYLNPNS
tara:strand:- start:98 stop:514 length:417 start_codon:yes stop_codon:yes gene_type:complete